ncbi:MAG TPA: hypothetical protein DCQ04_01590 [Actinobacteria bacterium]|nr:hypothetical protein [Actinomycetota bacterium]
MCKSVEVSLASVAVVIPVGRVDGILDEQVRRVLAQQCLTLCEVVLSMNTSVASDQAMARTLVADLGDARLRLVDSSDSRGAAHARNVGFRATAATHVAFCDADDLVHEDWLAPLVRGLDHHDAVSGHLVDVFPDGKTPSWHPAATPGGLPRFLGKPYLLSGNLAIRRSAFESVGGFDETLTRCEDIALSWSLLRAGFAIGYVDDAIIDYRHRAGLGDMLHQHYLYGRGMTEVLRTHGIPSDSGWSTSRRSYLRLLRPNGQRAPKRTVIGLLRRGAIGLGRARGLLSPAAHGEGRS